MSKQDSHCVHAAILECSRLIESAVDYQLVGSVLIKKGRLLAALLVTFVCQYAAALTFFTTTGLSRSSRYIKKELNVLLAGSSGNSIRYKAGALPLTVVASVSKDGSTSGNGRRSNRNRTFVSEPPSGIEPSKTM